jgi:hypothetical protein
MTVQRRKDATTGYSKHILCLVVLTALHRCGDASMRGTAAATCRERHGTALH